VPDTCLAHWFRVAIAFAKLEGLLLHPVSFRKFRGDAAELLFSPAERGTRLRFWLSLALARAAKSEAFSGRMQCRFRGLGTFKLYAIMGILTR
jgi:hypothetical protein